MILTVSAFAVEENQELAVYSVSFGGTQAGSEWMVSLQLPLDISDQDISLGHDTYALTTSTGATHYGGIMGWGLWPEGIYLDLNDAAAKVLGLENKVKFKIPEAKDAHSSIQIGLTRILGLHI